MIATITEKARAMLIDSQAPVRFWGEAVFTAVYLRRCSPNNGLIKRDDRDGYRALYDTPYEMLQIYGKPAIDKDGNAVSYKALSTIYDDSAALNAHTSFPEPEEADPLGLPQDEVHVEVLDIEHTPSIPTQWG